jgi:predicted amidohydrolase
MDNVAVIQMVSGADLSANLETAGRLIAEAAAAGARLVVLPENFALFNSSELQAAGVRESGEKRPIRRFLMEQARTHELWLVGGSLPMPARSDGRVRASCFVFDNEGREVARYDKLHLFDADVGDKQSAYRESDTYEAGDELVVVDTPVGCLGLCICYDLRFPELFQALRELGAELISVPAAFTRVTGEAHWEVLLRARAIETQCYLLAAGQGGKHCERRETYGHSMIIDPWGTILGRHAEAEGVVTGEVDLEYLQAVRRKMPLQKQRRLPLGGKT